MTIKRSLLFNYINSRKNPYSHISSEKFTEDDLLLIANSIAELEQAVYKDTQMPLKGPESILEALQSYDIKFSAVVYDTSNGGTKLGPYIGYLIAYLIEPKSSEHFNLLYSIRLSLLNRVQTCISEKDNDGVEALEHMLNQFQQLIKSAKKFQRPIIFICDAARLNTSTAKKEFASLVSQSIESFRSLDAIVIALAKQTTSYKVIKHLEHSGTLDVVVDVLDTTTAPKENLHLVVLDFGN